MSVATRSPLRMVGGLLASGGPNTGEVKYIRAGDFCGAIWSGAVVPVLTGTPTGAVTSGNHVLFVAGAGRLNTILPHVQMASGLPVYFYDASALALSGVSVSGQRIIGVLPGTWLGGTYSGTGLNVGSPFNGEPIRPEMPFASGLCAAVPSGCPGFTASWTVEVVPQVP